MADDDGGRVKYETKTVKVVRGTEGRSRAKWEADGWELVGQDTGKLRSELRFRRPKPPLPKAAILGGVAVMALIIVVGIISILVGGSQDSDGTAAASRDASTSPTASPFSSSSSSRPSPAKSASASPSARASAPQESKPAAGALSAGKVESVFEEYIAQRADANVLVAKAVTDVVLLGPVLRVTFDPSEVGMTQSQFDAANPFNNPYDKSESLADFVAAAVTSSSNRDLRVRRSVAVIAAVDANGKLIGKRTMDEIVRLNGLPK